MIERGDVRWFRYARPDKRRPVLVLGRPEVIPSLSQLVVVPFSTTIRALPWEVIVDQADGLVVRCTLKFEWIRAIERVELGARICGFPMQRWSELRPAMLRCLGLDE